MSFNYETTRLEYIGNDTSNSFSYSFLATKSSDVKVVVYDTVNKVEYVLAEGTQYIVNNVGDPSGGSIQLNQTSIYTLTDGTFNLKTDYTLIILADYNLDQQTDIRNNGDFYPEVHEDHFDYSRLIDIILSEKISRSVKTSIGENREVILPAPPTVGSFVPVLFMDSVGDIKHNYLNPIVNNPDYNLLSNRPTIPSGLSDFGIANATAGQVLTSNGISSTPSFQAISFPVTSVAGRVGAITLSKSDVGLNSVDNTSDAAKPVSTAQQTALNLKADVASLSNVATSGDYNDLTNQPALFNGDYNSLSNLPTLFSGDYNDLTNLPILFDGDYNTLSNQPTVPSTLADLVGDGLSGQFLQSNGDGTFSFVAAPGSSAKFVDGTNVADAVYTGGNVGIGTATPNGLLQVLGTLSSITIPTTGNQIEMNRDDINYIRAFGGPSARISIEANNNDAQVLLRENGRVGIGTFNPDTKLHVNGDLKIDTVTQDDSLVEVLVKDANGIVKYRDASTIGTSFSGDYNDLTNKPVIPTSLLNLGVTDGTTGQILSTNGSGVFTFIDAPVGFSGDYADLINKPLNSLGLNANILKYTDQNGTETDIDLSLYLDDTNLARLVSGTLDPATGVATFTRDDTTTFTLDLSNLASSPDLDVGVLAETTAIPDGVTNFILTSSGTIRGFSLGDYTNDREFHIHVSGTSTEITFENYSSSVPVQNRIGMFFTNGQDTTVKTGDSIKVMYDSDTGYFQLLSIIREDNSVDIDLAEDQLSRANTGAGFLAGGVREIQWVGLSNFEVRGFTMADYTQPREFHVTNESANGSELTLLHQSSLSNQLNQVETLDGNDIVLSQGDSVRIYFEPSGSGGGDFWVKEINRYADSSSSTSNYKLARYYKSTNQTVPTGSFNDITFETNQYTDTHVTKDANNIDFTVNEAGIYSLYSQFYVAFNFANNDFYQHDAYLKINGVAVAVDHFRIAGASNTNNSYICKLTYSGVLSVGDVISIQYFPQNSSFSDREIYNQASRTYLTIERMV